MERKTELETLLFARRTGQIKEEAIRLLSRLGHQTARTLYPEESQHYYRWIDVIPREEWTYFAERCAWVFWNNINTNECMSPYDRVLEDMSDYIDEWDSYPKDIPDVDMWDTYNWEARAMRNILINLKELNNRMVAKCGRRYELELILAATDEIAPIKMRELALKLYGKELLK